MSPALAGGEEGVALIDDDFYIDIYEYPNRPGV